MNSATFFTELVALSNAIVAVFSYILAAHKTKNDKQTKIDEKVKQAEDNLEDACNNGSLSDLIDAAKKIGDAKR